MDEQIRDAIKTLDKPLALWWKSLVSDEDAAKAIVRAAAEITGLSAKKAEWISYVLVTHAGFLDKGGDSVPILRRYAELAQEEE